MKNVYFKKMLCVLLSASFMLPNSVRAESSKYRFNADSLKKTAKKAAPYIGVGVPVLGILVAGVILWPKHTPKSDQLSNNQIPQNRPDAVIGDTARAEMRSEQIAKGRLEGFQFYRLSGVTHRTYHAYIITDSDKASQVLGLEKDSDDWYKIVAYQNRWLAKGTRTLLNRGWSFENLFGVESTFYNSFNEITNVDKDKRKGVEELEKNIQHSFGGVVFSDPNDPALNSIQKNVRLIIISSLPKCKPEELFERVKSCLSQQVDGE